MKLQYRFLIVLATLMSMSVLFFEHQLLKTRRRLLTPRLFLHDLQDVDDTFKSGNVIKSIMEINSRKVVKVRGHPTDRLSDIDHDGNMGFPDHHTGPMMKTLKTIQEQTTHFIDKFHNNVKMADTLRKDIITRFSGKADVMVKQDFAGIGHSKINTKQTESIVYLEPTRGIKGRNSGQLKMTLNKADSSKLQKLSNVGCEVIDDRTRTNISTPFKIYVYDMPAKFTAKAIDCIKTSHHADCMDLGSCGIGTELNKDDILSIHNSHQFSLEVVIHHKMLTSPYRTLNPAAADIFYAPIYGGALCDCFRNATKKRQIVKDFFKFLLKTEYFNAGRPHLSALPRIQRENAHNSWPILAHKLSHELVYLTIEKELAPERGLRNHNPKVKVIPVPYPSYAHYHPDGLVKDGQNIRLLRKHFLERDRNVFLFWAAGGRKSNWLRGNIIMPQFNSTKLSYRRYMNELTTKHRLKETMNRHLNVTNVSSETSVPALWLLTPECWSYHRHSTIPWMQHSTFCLQPPGDSPTRKSIYDSILAGCIPVLFDHKYGQVPLPYSRKLNYTEFTVSLSLAEQLQTNYVEILKSRYTAKDIKRLQKRLVEVAPLFQYSFPLNNGEPKDAMAPIMDEVKEVFKL
ncbi:uncharacterized protein LOC135494545 [Lineus longissimus]|uniref:uncharacterized protein LOC135494545 n=1 Tax=Lineus longissimus TaxID=88925 RepID=UPI00315C5FFC